MKHKKKHRNRIWFDIIIMGVVLCVLICGFYYIYKDVSTHNDSMDTVDDIITKVVTEVESLPDETIDENLYRRIDFDALRAINADISRWLYVPDTAIDAYVMQEVVNGEYYYDLRNIYKQHDGVGSFLIPASPNDAVEDAHTLILGHRMNDYNGEWQFSNLPTRWGDISGADEYPYVYTYRYNRAERWRVWAVMDAQPEDMIYDIPYELGSDEYERMLQHVANSARYQTDAIPDKNIPTLFLSTCNYTGDGPLGRFALICIPDAYYEYNTSTYVDWLDEYRFQLWKNQHEEFM